MKEKESAFAIFVWITAGIIYHVRYSGWASLISLKALIFFGVGIFIAGIIIGIINYELHGLLVKVLMKFKVMNVDFIRLLGIALMIPQTAITAYGAYLFYSLIY